jgi:heparosan-N-sulfate-glucuronate 5-epimerase
LAKHQMFLSSGNDEDLKAFKQCVTKVISLISWASDKGYIVQKGDKKYGSFASGMIIGEILSLLTRLYELEKDISLLKMGDGILHYFESSISDNGVIGYFSKTNSSWYEEYAFEPVKHVLNGMNYALIGLHDLAKIGGSEKAKLHFENGIEWLKKALPEYDLGWWSNYFVAEGKLPNYIASAMYHNLHIEQLRYLCKITQSELIGEYCQKFESYPKSMTRRLYAGWCLFRDKLTRK